MRGGKGESEISKAGYELGTIEGEAPSRFECRIPESGECLAIMFEVLCCWLLLEWIFAHRHLPGVAQEQPPRQGRLKAHLTNFFFNLRPRT